MAYRIYHALDCASCGQCQGFVENDGRERRSCSDKCRQAAYRERRKRALRHAALLRNGPLEQRWKSVGITGDLREGLRTLSLASGEAAATLATEAVLLAVREVRAQGGKRSG